MNGKRCVRCNTEKALAQFGVDRAHPDGLRSSCKECFNARANAQRGARDNPVAVLTKRCPQCVIIKPAGDFYSNRRAADGLTTYCKGCNGQRFAAWSETTGYNERYAERSRAFREQVLAHYGTVCACCGEHRYEFLAIDHVDGNGAAHRRQIGKSRMDRWLAKSGFPSGFQVLCHNCNMAKGLYGACPHQKRRSLASV